MSKTEAMCKKSPNQPNCTAPLKKCQNIVAYHRIFRILPLASCAVYHVIIQHRLVRQTSPAKITDHLKYALKNKGYKKNMGEFHLFNS